MSLNANPDAPTHVGHRIRVERERQRLGLRELSRHLGVSASMISQIERGRTMPSVNTLYAITSLLGISLDDLFSPSRTPADGATDGRPHRTTAQPRRPDRPNGVVVRRGTSKTLALGAGVRWELLTSKPHHGVDFLRATYEPGSESAPADGLIRHSGHEAGTVVRGRLSMTVGFETVELGPGDTISFGSSIPHRHFNRGDIDAVAIWFVIGRGRSPLFPAT